MPAQIETRSLGSLATTYGVALLFVAPLAAVIDHTLGESTGVAVAIAGTLAVMAVSYLAERRALRFNRDLTKLDQRLVVLTQELQILSGELDRMRGDGCSPAAVLAMEHDLRAMKVWCDAASSGRQTLAPDVLDQLAFHALAIAGKLIEVKRTPPRTAPHLGFARATAR
jgi:hypothetical protein